MEAETRVHEAAFEGGVSVGIEWWWGLWDAGDVEEVDAEECDDEAHEKGDCVGAVGCVEALEEDEGSDDGCGGEANVVHRIYARSGIRVM